VDPVTAGQPSEADSSQAAAVQSRHLLTKGRDHGDKGQELEEEHGEEASPKNAEREARGEKEQEVETSSYGTDSSMSWGLNLSRET
jgi:hypothetical protein